MSQYPLPAPENAYLAEHVQLLCQSYTHFIGESFIDPSLSPLGAAIAVFQAPFIVVSHNTAPDPIFNYANQTALDLFEMSWAEFTSLPSLQSAELPNQAERSQLLAAVTQQGYIQQYSGIRIAKSGRRFRMSHATVWNVIDDGGIYRGQAAFCRSWSDL